MKGFIYLTGIKSYGYKLLFTTSALIFAFSGIRAQDHKLNADYMTHTLQKVPQFKGFEGGDSIPHYFLELYGGSSFSLAPAAKGIQHPGMEMGAAVGRWITPIHGARLGVFGKYYISYPLGKTVKSNELGASLDYLMNLSALAEDFNANRKFELLGIAGGEYLLPQFKKGANGTFGIRTGLQARFALNQGSVFFIEPRVGIYSDNLDFTDSWRGYNVAGSIVGGVEFRTLSRSKRSTEKFTTSAFRDHSFLISGMGIGSLVAQGGSNFYKYMGGSFFAGAGRWLSPFSGVRVVGKASVFKYPPTKSKVSGIGVQADYLLNITNAFYGYNPQRIFNLIGVGGVNYDFIRNKEYSNLIGVGAGMQASVRLSDEISFFVEPRLNFYPDKYYAIGTNGAGKCRANFMINTGFELMSSPMRRGVSHEKLTSGSWLDNMFIGVAFGVNSPLKQAAFYKNNVDPRMAGYIGKWFTSTSGVRLSADLGKLWKSSKYPSAKIATIGADYLWNISSFMNGYDPQRKFELIAAAGANLAFRSSSLTHKTYLGGELSLQGLWNVTPALGVFVEPQLRLYNDNFAERSIRVAKLDGVVSVMGGMHIRLKDYTREQKQLFKKEDTNHSYYSFSGGTTFLATHIKRANAFGASGQAAYGKWVTPVAGWRLGVNGEYKQENNIKYIYGGAEADYMVSLSNMAFGYDPDRRVNMNAFTGVNVGLDHEWPELSFVTGVSAGGQLVYKASKAIDVFVEPKATLRYRFRYNSVNNTRPVMNVQIGVNYKLPADKAANKKK
ncbi:hypothetical protein [uncultured Bacteroides sp.]|uniref:hypothetical protein n=1 Tax=uncultured Bacteroides sp. TaxID=162156 RepID=UPI002AA7442D|nr:hypothetical protein [uncultured Bacteroides sp.]